MKIQYITSNPGKFHEATLILSDWELVRVDIDLEEIQGTAKEVIVEKAKAALKIVQSPLIVEDVSMRCTALNGLPGPYLKDFLIALGDDGLAKMIHKYEDHSATVTCMAAYIAPDEDPQIFEGTIEGKIVPPKGENRHGKISWNPIFKPKGTEHTMGELTMEEHSKLSMRKIALKKLRDYLHSVENKIT